MASAALVAAESILALTPIVIKTTTVDPITAIWTRVLSSSVLGYLLTSDRGLPRGEWLGATALGYTNLLHIACSYESFRNLPAGQAMSLLYTYPFWNLVLASVFKGELIQPHEYGAIGIATVGSILLNMEPGVAATNMIGRTANPPWGVFMGLIMALTEAGMITILKALNWRDPAKSIWIVNAGASLWLGLMLLVQGGGSGPSEGGSWWDTAFLTSFHSLSLFGGYWLRFYAVPRLSTVNYSFLSYAGLLASYVFGLLFLGEKPGVMSVLGAIAIACAGLLIQNFDLT